METTSHKGPGPPFKMFTVTRGVRGNLWKVTHLSVTQMRWLNNDPQIQGSQIRQVGFYYQVPPGLRSAERLECVIKRECCFAYLNHYRGTMNTGHCQLTSFQRTHNRFNNYILGTFLPLVVAYRVWHTTTPSVHSIPTKDIDGHWYRYLYD